MKRPPTRWAASGVFLAGAAAWFGLACVWVMRAATGGAAVHELSSLLVPGVVLLGAVVLRALTVPMGRGATSGDLPDAQPLTLSAGLGALFALVVLVWASYRSALESGFYQDDWRLLSYAEQVVSLGPFSGAAWLFTECLDMMYRPAAWFATAFDQWIWAGDPFGFHLSNLGWHVLVSWLVFLLARRILGGTAAGLAVALLYASHPLHAEAVAYVTVREESIAAAGFLGAMLFYLQSRTSGRRRDVVLGLVCAGAAFLSKEHTVTLPVAILVAEWLLVRRKASLWDRLRPALPYGCLLIAFVALRTWVLGGSLGYEEPTGFNPHLDFDPARLFSALFSGVPTVLMVPLPFTLAEEGGSALTYGAIKGAVAFLMGTAMLCLLVARRGLPWRVLGFAAIWPLLTILPVATLLPPIDDLYRMRYYYLPAVGWAIGIVVVGRAVTGSPVIRTALFSVCMAYLLWGRALVVAPWLQEGRQARRGADAADVLAATGLAPTDSVFVSGAPDAVSRALYYRLRRVVPDPPTVVGINRSMRVHEIDSPASEGHPLFHPAALGEGRSLLGWVDEELVELTDVVVALHARARETRTFLPSWNLRALASDSTVLRGAALRIEGEGLSFQMLDDGERPWLELPVRGLDGADVWAVRVRASVRYDGGGARDNALRSSGEDLVWEIGMIASDGKEVAVPFPVAVSDEDGDWMVEVGRHPAWLQAQDIDRLTLNVRGPAQRVSIREITCLRWNEVHVD